MREKLTNFIDYNQLVTRNFAEIGPKILKATFVAKFMPHSDSYIASYQVEQALIERNRATRTTGLKLKTYMILGGTYHDEIYQKLPQRRLRRSNC